LINFFEFIKIKKTLYIYKVHPSKYSNSLRKTSTGAQGVTISQFVTHTGGLCGRWFNDTASTNCDLVSIA